MKKFSTVLLILAICSSSFAQTGKKPIKTQRFGFRASPNFCWIKSTDKLLVNDGVKMAFSYGFNFQEKINKTLWYEIGMDISRIDGRLTNNYPQIFKQVTPLNADTTNKVSYSMKLNYIEIPISFVGKTNEIGYMTYTFQGGLTPAILLSQNATIKKADSVGGDFKGKLNSNRPDDFIATSDDVSFFRMAFVMGAGMEYALTKDVSIVAGIRYSNGMFRTNKNKAYDSYRTNYFAINVGILF
ncbi:MAG: outer membrane beta-barrel protein [Bacteroidota bacterium]|nr:outer membrane beta-barrel protein [Bacteroidota bacterium]